MDVGTRPGASFLYCWDRCAEAVWIGRTCHCSGVIGHSDTSRYKNVMMSDCMPLIGWSVASFDESQERLIYKNQNHHFPCHRPGSGYILASMATFVVPFMSHINYATNAKLHYRYSDHAHELVLDCNGKPLRVDQSRS